MPNIYIEGKAEVNFLENFHLIHRQILFQGLKVKIGIIF